MRILEQSQRTLQRSICFFLIGLLCSACDGGLFGTGDGDLETVEIIETSSPPTSIPSAGDVEPDQGEEPAPTTPSLSFNNSLSGSIALPSPRVRLINLSQSRVLVLSDPSDGNALISGPLVPLSVSETLAIEAGDNTIDILDAVTNTQLVEISPLSAAANSVTSAIAYETNPGQIDIVFLADETSSRSPDTSLLRIVQVTPIQESSALEELRLVPSDNLSGATEQTVTGISIQSRQESPYSTLLPGSYQLVDPLGRIEVGSIDLLAARSYTIVLSNTLEPPILLIDNSER